jgi:hypothetical protein
MGVFREREEILISDLCLGCATLEGIGATKLKVSEYPNRFVPNKPIEDFLKLGCGFVTRCIARYAVPRTNTG